MNARPYSTKGRNVMRARRDRLIREARNLDPASALALAVECLRELENHGIDYGDFQNAQAVGRAVRHSRNKLSLHV